MSVAAASYYPSVTADVVSGNSWLPPARSVTNRLVAESQNAMLLIEVPEFDFSFGTPLINLQTKEDYSVVKLEALLDPGLVVLLILRTQVADDAGNLQIKEVSISFDVTEHKPCTHFLAASLYAMLSLAGPIQVMIPGIGLDLTAHFKMPLREVSTLLQSRQAYYGLMVIERATGMRINIPEHISGDDMNSISFAYHAIVERTFDWLAKFITLPVPAREESLGWFTSLQSTVDGGSVYKLRFGPTSASRTILGQAVALGPEIVFIEDGVFQDRAEVLRELSQLDGHLVPVVVRPISGMGRYDLSHAPRLPDSPWDKKIEACIRLEDRLNELLANKYNELAASTVAGLAPEQIEIITARPTLHNDAHLIKE